MSTDAGQSCQKALQFDKSILAMSDCERGVASQKVNKFLQNVPGKPQVAGPPAQRDFGIQSAVFGVLAATILIQV